MTISKFIIRVYGIWIDENDQVLLSDEIYDRTSMTKFPGGGMELGEGPIECVRREWKEELGVEIKVLGHFYTTDFFQQSAFHDDAQIMSIYYFVEPTGNLNVQLDSEPREGVEAFRKIPISELSEETVTWPIDKMVVGMLTQGN
ncbi:MAG: NUDIX hydrolase [Flavobacteriales bacterium]|nr:NUDIX hydrolase [Flavobacteriales bacterium]